MEREEIEKLTLEEITHRLIDTHGFTQGSISILKDKGFKKTEDLLRFLENLEAQEETFEGRRKKKSWREIMLDRGDSEEITTGRYNRYVREFKNISSEQVLVQGRTKFAVEYVIALADEVAEPGSAFIQRPFTEEEKAKLRSIYEDFTTQDYVAMKLIEGKTKHDIVATNAWVTIRAQQLGLDDSLMRSAIHFARTSADVNTNVLGELYTRALGQWTKSLAELIETLHVKATQNARTTCVAETHGQPAQLTTLGHIYANLAEQIKRHAKPLLQTDRFRLNGKIAGAIGTEVDMKAAFPDLDTEKMYRHLVEDVFGLEFVELGNDQDCTNDAMSTMLDTMVNVGLVIQKAATDTWIYASRHILAKQTDEEESGSSAMPQKANPFLAEGCEALNEIISGMVTPIKKLIVAYREQGDLRRSITKREGYHPIMLSIIAMQRLIIELNKYEQHPVSLEAEVCRFGPQIASSAVQTYLRKEGVEDAYDKIKHLVMRPFIKPDEITNYIDGLVEERTINPEVGNRVKTMLHSVMDVKGNLTKLAESSGETQERAIRALEKRNTDLEARSVLLGDAYNNSHRMIANASETIEALRRYG